MIRASRLAVLAALAVPALAPLAIAPARALGLSVVVGPEALTVGDRAEVVLTLTGERSEIAGEPRFPAWGESWGDAEVVEAGPVEPAFGPSEENGEPRMFEQRVVLVAFRPGSVALPPKKVTVRTSGPAPGGTIELSSPADLALHIDSVLPTELADASASDLEARPPAPPRPLPLGAAFWATLAGGVTILLGLFLLARRRRASRAAAAPRAAPRDELAAALDAASGAPDPESGHVRLSLALRRFLGRSFGFRAIESTTSEVRRRLRDRRVPPGAEAKVHDLLIACDRVKFAREGTSRAALEERVEAVREIAREVEEHLRPPDAPESRRERAA